MIDPGVAYEGTRLQISRICEQTDTDRPVPACPDWSVHDVVAHLVGLADDVLGGNTDGYATQGWTGAQVAQRRSRPTAKLLTEWASLAPRLLDLLPELPASMGAAIVVDVVSHEHDLRGALALPGDRRSDAVRLATGNLVEGLRASHARAGLPPLTLIAGGEREYALGRGRPAGTVEASLFSFFRSLSGRRTRAETAAFEWTVDSEPFLDRWLQFPFSWPAVTLREG